jgi:hypothetical protein
MAVILLPVMRILLLLLLLNEFPFLLLQLLIYSLLPGTTLNILDSCGLGPRFK